MANEIEANLRIKAVDGKLVVPFGTSGQIKFDWTTKRYFHRTFDVLHTAETSITTYGDVSTPGVIGLYNHDADNFIDWGFDTALLDARLMPGEMPHFLRASASFAGIRLQADTATAKVEVLILEV